MNEIIAAVAYKDGIYVFSKDGTVWRLWKRELDHEMLMEIALKIDLRPR